MDAGDVGSALAEPARQLVDHRIVVFLGAMPLVGPAPHLSLEVSGWSADVAEPDRLPVDRVDCDEHVDEAFAERPALALASSPVSASGSCGTTPCSRSMT